MRSGKFIVFEGPNACGKGVQITHFQDNLRSIGKAVPVFITGEPNNTFDNVWGVRARELLEQDGDPYTNQIEALNCFSKNRIINNSIFKPPLLAGANIISDRYYHSTFAFQHAQGVPYNEIARVNISDDIRIPDLTYMIVVPVEISLERLAKRDSGKKRKFEGDTSFMKKVLDNYLEQPTILPDLMQDESIVLIDGSRSIGEVSKQIWEDFTHKFL
jgi:dTMP kinase